MSKIKIIFLLFILFSHPAYSKNKMLKGSLIGLGTGFVISSVFVFYSTYDFQKSRFTTDPMPLVTGWAVFVPVSTLMGFLAGGTIGYFIKE